MSEYVAVVELVSDTIVDQVFPVSIDLSITYPVIGKPPLFVGVSQVRSICEDDLVVDTNPVGEDGGVIRILVVADAMLEVELVPAELIADILYAYGVLETSPVSEYVVNVEPVLD